MNNGTKIQRGEWNPETISRFWNFAGKQTGSIEKCFSRQVGKGLINFMKFSGKFNSGISVLDYGCGPGYLVEHLLDNELSCYAIDSSDELVELVNEKFKDTNGWKGAIEAFKPPLPFEDNYFDLITFIEVIEHLEDNNLNRTLNEIFRLLKPGGVAIITTPNEENLLLNNVYCPFCNTEFHNRQHMRSFSWKLMHDLLIAAGFKVLFCKGIDFSVLQNPPSIKNVRGIRSFVKWFSFKIEIFLDSIFPEKPFKQRAFLKLTENGKNRPHLCAFVEK